MLANLLYYTTLTVRELSALHTKRLMVTFDESEAERERDVEDSTREVSYGCCNNQKWQLQNSYRQIHISFVQELLCVGLFIVVFPSWAIFTKSSILSDAGMQRNFSSLHGVWFCDLYYQHNWNYAIIIVVNCWISFEFPADGILFEGGGESIIVAPEVLALCFSGLACCLTKSIQGDR